MVTLGISLLVLALEQNQRSFARLVQYEIKVLMAAAQQYHARESVNLRSHRIIEKMIDQVRVVVLQVVHCDMEPEVEWNENSLGTASMQSPTEASTGLVMGSRISILQQRCERHSAKRTAYKQRTMP